MAEQQDQGGGGGLFAKSGKDSFNLFGKKIPFAAVAGVAALIGVLLYMRARSQGASASVGAVPGAAANTGVNPAVDYTGGSTPDYSAALANLSQQLTSLSQSSVNSPTAAAATPALTTIAGGGKPGAPGSLGGIPVYSSPSDAAAFVLQPFSTTYAIAGPAVAGGAYGGFEQVKEPSGAIGYIHGVDVGSFGSITH